jgi:hypothetical protein
MRRSRFTKLTSLAVGLLFASLTVCATSQVVRENHPLYDVSKEVTLTGTVANVLTKAEAGTIPGSHLMLTTPSGEVDASLGKWGLAGKDAPSVKAGEQIELTGVMKTTAGKDVFIVRTVHVNGRIYPIRNEHGVPVSQLGRAHANQIAAQKGESL